MRASSVVLLPHAPTSVAAARRRLGSELAAVGVSESVVDDVNVIVSELLSNALRHARPLPGGQVRLAWSRQGDELELSVSDGGATTQPRRGPGTLSSLGGRGLGIVEALSENWGVRHEEGGVTTVWAVLRAPRTVRTGAGRNGAVPAGSVHAAIPGLVELPEEAGHPDEDLRHGPRHGIPQTRAYPG
nr:ATP-binding protein [Actinomadura kijaniata]